MPTQSQYASPEQLNALSITDARFDEFPIASITAHLQAASSMADQYLSSQFDLPLSEWDMMLTKAVCDIAAKELFSQFGYNPNAPGDFNIQRRFDEAMKWLGQVARQEVHPQYLDSSSSTPSAGPFVSSNSTVGFGQDPGVSAIIIKVGN